MDASLYTQIIKDLCQCVGIDRWDEVVHNAHILVDGKIVGLIHDESDIHHNELYVYIELDPVGQVCPEEIYRRMLAENLRRHETLRGYWGVHPDVGSAVYCIRLEWTHQLECRELAEFLCNQVQAAARLFEVLKECRFPQLPFTSFRKAKNEINRTDMEGD